MNELQTVTPPVVSVTPSPLEQTNQALAAKWRCDLRSIQRWRKEGAPLTGSDDEMKTWLRTRRRIPATTAALMERSPTTARSVPPPQAKRPPRPLQPPQNGQGPALDPLARLEAEEHSAHTLLQALRADPDASEAERDAAFDTWIKCQEALRKNKATVQKALTSYQAEVKLAIGKAMALLFEAIEREFTVQLPPTLKGLDEHEIQLRLLKTAESFKAILRKALQS